MGHSTSPFFQDVFIRVYLIVESSTGFVLLFEVIVEGVASGEIVRRGGFFVSPIPQDGSIRDPGRQRGGDGDSGSSDLGGWDFVELDSTDDGDKPRGESN